jgi:hypothetical protein
MLVRLAVDLFVTVMVSVNWQPVPTLAGAGTRVMSSAFQVQELVVKFGVRQVVDPENRAFALLKPVVLSVDKAALLMLNVKSLKLVGVM